MSQLDLWWLRRRVLQGFAVSPEFKGFLWLVWPDVGGSSSWRERVSGCWWRFCLLGSFGAVFFFAECYLSFGCGFWWAGFVFEVCQSDGTSLQVALIGLLCPRVRVGAPLWLILSRFQRSLFVPSFVRAHYPSEVGVMVLVAVLA
ncbi:hypothetical protein ISN45_Aa02g022350, partial [Arabidopsis thaliana x Arabidopsis arenosa]